MLLSGLILYTRDHASQNGSNVYCVNSLNSSRSVIAFARVSETLGAALGLPATAAQSAVQRATAHAWCRTKA